MRGTDDSVKTYQVNLAFYRKQRHAMRTTSTMIEQEQAKELAIQLGKTMNLAPFEVGAICEELVGTVDECWAVVLAFEEDPDAEFDFSPSFTTVTVNKRTGEAVLLNDP